jgi:anti-sigma regulatory factor (Ser/Thr protein kinase)
LAITARESLTVVGRADRVPVARAFVGALLSEHPCGQTAELLASELVTNSVRHSGSRLPGQVITITAAASGDAVVIEVTDRSGSTVPALLPDGDDMAEGGRGLRLVDALAFRWGFHRSGDHTTTWFECMP